MKKKSVTQGVCDGSCRVTDKRPDGVERKGQERGKLPK